MLNMFYPVIKSLNLKGAYTNSPKPTLSFKDWWSGEYQELEDKYLNDHFGLRSDLVRLHTQLNYSFFGKLLSRDDIVEGKSGYYFEKGYIDSYLGTKANEDSIIFKEALKIAEIQDYFKAINKPFVFVVATGKAWMFPQYIPDDLQNEKQISDYEKYLYYFDSLHISYIDFNAYFVANKGKLSYPTITRQSTHWSSYGSALAMDSLVKYLNLQYNFSLYPMKINCEESEYYNDHDKEIMDALNLMFPGRSTEITCHPNFEFDTTSGAPKHSFIFSADSYFWEPYGQKMFHRLAKSFEFWYYNNEMWDNQNNYRKLDIEYISSKLDSTDCFVMMSSEMHINSVTESIYQAVINKKNRF